MPARRLLPLCMHPLQSNDNNLHGRSPTRSLGDSGMRTKSQLPSLRPLASTRGWRRCSRQSALEATRWTSLATPRSRMAPELERAWRGGEERRLAEPFFWISEFNFGISRISGFSILTFWISGFSKIKSMFNKFYF